MFPDCHQSSFQGMMGIGASVVRVVGIGGRPPNAFPVVGIAAGRGTCSKNSDKLRLKIWVLGSGSTDKIDCNP